MRGCTTGSTKRGWISSSLKRASTVTVPIPVGSTVAYQPYTATMRPGPDTTRHSTSSGENTPFAPTFRTAFVPITRRDGLT